MRVGKYVWSGAETSRKEVCGARLNWVELEGRTSLEVEVTRSNRLGRNGRGKETISKERETGKTNLSKTSFELS